MSFTARFLSHQIDKVPAVSHIDGTARLQTVTKEENELFHKLIETFYRRSGVPMVLNTSMNRKKQPIVETPMGAISTFLACQGTLTYLYMGAVKISRKEFPYLSKKEDDVSKSDVSNWEDVLIAGQQVYLSEVTSSGRFNGLDEMPVRVRIQDGAWNEIDSSIRINSEETNQWRELPSMFHLEILQLLQSSNDMGEDGESQSSIMITVQELFDAIEEIRGPVRDEIESSTVLEELKVEFEECLRWLYSHGLVYFESLLDDEAAMNRLLQDTEVLDLRSL